MSRAEDQNCAQLAVQHAEGGQFVACTVQVRSTVMGTYELNKDIFIYTSTMPLVH